MGLLSSLQPSSIDTTSSIISREESSLPLTPSPFTSSIEDLVTTYTSQILSTMADAPSTMIKSVSLVIFDFKYHCPSNLFAFDSLSTSAISAMVDASSSASASGSQVLPTPVLTQSPPSPTSSILVLVTASPSIGVPTSALSTVVDLESSASKSVSQVLSSPVISPSTVSPVAPSSSIFLPSVNDTEELVVIVLAVPVNEDVSSDEFKSKMEKDLLNMFNEAVKKDSARRRRQVVEETRELSGFIEALKRRDVSSRYNVKHARFRRATNDYRVQVVSVKRVNPESEMVEIQYRVLQGNRIVPAAQVTELTSKLSKGEIGKVMEYTVERRPYPAAVQATAQPATKGTDPVWTAVIVACSVIAIIIILIIYIKCVARKRKRVRSFTPEQVKSDAPSPPVNASRDLPYYREYPTKPKDLYRGKKPRRQRPSSSSESSDEMMANKTLPPLPKHSALEPDVEIHQPREKHLRRIEVKERDERPRKFTEDHARAAERFPTDRRSNISEKRPKSAERYPKRTKQENIEMKHVAGVVENTNQLGQNLLLAHDPMTRPQVPVRLSPLPPLVQTPLITGKSPRGKMNTESGLPQAWKEPVPLQELHNLAVTNLGRELDTSNPDDAMYIQANVERWRNKQRQREKLRQEMREKERAKEEKLKRENVEAENQDQALPPLEMSYDAISRRQKSRRDRWLHNRVGTSDSVDSSSTMGSGTETRLEEEELLKQELERLKRKRKKRKAKKQAQGRVGVSGRVAKSSAQDALRESNWVTDDAPQGVRLVAVRPHDQMDHNTQGAHPQRQHPVAPVSPRQQQSQYIHDLLNNSYPIIPKVGEPASPYVSSPRESVLIDVAEEVPPDVNLYESIAIPDPYVPQYGGSISFEDETSPRYYDNNNTYEEPSLTPAALPESSLTYPNGPVPQPKVFVPTAHARGLTGPTTSSPIKGRPTSARQSPQGTRPTRPSSAHASPSSIYAPRDPRQFAREVPPEPRPFAQEVPQEAPAPRRYGTRPTSAASTQPSLGTSPRYMREPQGTREPKDPYQEARSILENAQRQVDRFERGRPRDEPDAGYSTPQRGSGYSTPQRPPDRGVPRVTRIPPTPGKAAQGQIAALEKAELEAQMLVSRALARARGNVRT
ncbi:predicted protein [Nematostella vectensis]|uniref:Uncharacterized protein n=1 Tax=Nematostella vectensis TaxID=45351 RepID=A7SYV0_NEMVE|nr:predicted protein [Nematostella vectensis]|eukprot:XP_001623216.1 predicted protein [Nematostella vectensis]